MSKISGHVLHWIAIPKPYSDLKGKEALPKTSGRALIVSDKNL